MMVTVVLKVIVVRVMKSVIAVVMMMGVKIVKGVVMLIEEVKMVVMPIMIGKVGGRDTLNLRRVIHLLPWDISQSGTSTQGSV